MAPLAALLVGEITHVKDEWEKLSDRILLKVRRPRIIHQGEGKS